MATGKKSFVLYCDLIHTVQKMPNDKAGELFKHILDYVNDNNPTTTDLIIDIAFEPIKQQLKRDLEKWSQTAVKRSEIGRLGGMAKATKSKQLLPIGKNDKQNLANVPVNDNVNVTVNVNDNNIEERKLKFASTLEPFLSIYGREMLNNFFKYWTEPNKSKTKFRQELERTWDTERRLGTWASREKKSTNNQKGKIEQLNELYNEFQFNNNPTE
jgi:hypothetical protein